MYYRRQESRYPTGAAIDRLSSDLGLAEIDQDWELLAADPRRVAEFLDYYDTRQLNDDERFTLMSLIIASFDEFLYSGRDEVLQDRIVARISAEFDLLNYLVQHWAFPDVTDEEIAENSFHFTPIARQIMQSQYGDRENWPRSGCSIKRAEKSLPEQGVIDSVDLSDNRDGTFELSWSKIAGRDYGRREFSSVAEAMEFAHSQLAVAVDAWRVIE